MTHVFLIVRGVVRVSLNEGAVGARRAAQRSIDVALLTNSDLFGLCEALAGR
jgi:signal-transduction protein with cAMP-binding, CBS, and nucleotidyltransferase domain